jgi:hypothetical protein
MRAKFSPGDRVEVNCLHWRGDAVVRGWCPGTVVAVDARMAAIRCDAEVYANTGWPIADRVLWSAHGSPNLRPQTTQATS